MKEMIDNKSIQLNHTVRDQKVTIQITT